MMQRPGRLALLIFVLALGLRLGVAWAAGLFHVVGQTEVEEIARSLAETGQYGNPYSVPTGPTAHSTPVYPLFLAGVFEALGSGLAATAVLVSLTCALSALRCALVLLFALDAGLGRRTALFAGGLSVVYIPALRTELDGTTDGACLALALLAIVWSGLRLWRSRSWLTRTPWPFFVLCGFAALLDSDVLPPVAGFVLLGAAAVPAGQRGRYARQALTLTSTVLLFLLPWAIRNRLALGKMIWTKSNFGLEFWMSNGPGRTFDLATNMGRPDLHPSTSPEQALQVNTLGEVEYNREKLGAATAWVRANPGAFLRLTLQRVKAWWFPPGPSFGVNIAKYLLIPLAFVGLFLMFRLQPVTAGLILATWLTFPDVYYLIQWSSRYRFPMEWQLLVAGSVTLAAAADAFTGRRKREMA